MVSNADLSYEFVHLVKKIQNSPQDKQLKEALLGKISDMYALAKLNPIDQYRLAQMYDPASAQYQKMMQQSAERGCTNAMLALCDRLLQSSPPTQAKVNTVLHYMYKIEQSKDSYILEQYKALLKASPQWAALLPVNSPEENPSRPFGFFTTKTGKPKLAADKNKEEEEGSTKTAADKKSNYFLP